MAQQHSPKNSNKPVVDEENITSKTKLKQAADAVQEVGRKLVDLPKEKLNKLNLEESLMDAVLEAKRITANGAIRRQMQYIGRLMRDTDVAPIIEQLTKWEGKNQEENARFHQMERWRTRLLESQEAVSEFLNLYPQADSQQLRTLIRNAQKEASLQKPPKSSRELFKRIRMLMEGVDAEDEDGIDIAD